MKRITAFAAFMLAAIVLAAPAGAQEPLAGPKLFLGVEGLNQVPVDLHEQYLNVLRDTGLELGMPEFRDDLMTLDVEVDWKKGIVIRLVTDDEAAAYRRGYAKACSDIQLQYPDLELEGC